MEVKTAEQPTARYLSMDTMVDKFETSKPTLYKMLRAGLLPNPVRFGGEMRWPESDIEQWVEEGKAAL